MSKKQKQAKIVTIVIAVVSFSAFFIPAILNYFVVWDIDSQSTETKASTCIASDPNDRSAWFEFTRGTREWSFQFADGTRLQSYYGALHDQEALLRDTPLSELEFRYSKWMPGFNGSNAITGIYNKKTGAVILSEAETRQWFRGTARLYTIISAVIAIFYLWLLLGGKLDSWHTKRRQTHTRQKNRARRAEQKQRRAQIMAEQSYSTAGDEKPSGRLDQNASKKKRKRR